MYIPLTMRNTLIIIVVFLIVISTSAYFVQDRMNTISTLSSTDKNENIPSKTKLNNDAIISAKTASNPDSINISLAFFGDVFWGRYINEWSMSSPEQYNFPFRSLETINKSPEEYWVANLECPITDQDLSAETQENLLKFNCSPDYLPFAKPWFDAFSLANNHSDNMQEFNGYEQTQQYLSQNNFAHFGHFDNELSNLCTVVEVPAQGVFPQLDMNSSQSTTSEDSLSYSIPIALCGYHSVFRQLNSEEINYIQNFSQYIPTIAMPHSGEEYVTKPDQIKTDAYHGMIDAGADMVMGGHPHTVQSTEIYNNKLIVYSLGNFIFDQQFNQKVTTSLGIRANISVPYDLIVNDWQSLPKTCFNITSVCPEIKKLANKPTLSIAYKPIYASSSNKETKLANEVEQEYILNLSSIDKTLTEIKN